MGSICHLIGTNFDLLNPNFDKNLENVWILGLKGKKFVKICANKMTNWSHYPKLSTILKFRP